MKKITLVFILVASSTFAQQIYLEGGKTISSFDYRNSQGERLENLQATSQTFMAMGYRTPILTKNLYLSYGMSLASYGAIGSDDITRNFMEWNLNYFEFTSGLDVTLFKIKETQFYIKGTASVAFLLQGTQTTNNQVINLRNQDDFNENVFDFRGGFGFLQPISQKLSMYVQYLRGRSFMLKEGTAVTSDQEELRYVSDNFGFGFRVQL